MSELRRPRRSWGPWSPSGPSACCSFRAVSTRSTTRWRRSRPGASRGSIALQGAVGNQTAAGGQVTVQWTNGLQLSLNTSSKFLFQDLPVGSYALEVNIPPAAGTDFALELLRPDVEILPNSGGIADSLNIGTLEVPASGIVGGTVSPPAAGIVVGAFVPGASPNQIGIFEGFQTTTDSKGNYSFQLPAGNHALAASDANDNAVGPAVVISGVEPDWSTSRLAPVALERTDRRQPRWQRVWSLDRQQQRSVGRRNLHGLSTPGQRSSGRRAMLFPMGDTTRRRKMERDRSSPSMCPAATWSRSRLCPCQRPPPIPALPSGPVRAPCGPGDRWLRHLTGASDLAQQRWRSVRTGSAPAPTVARRLRHGRRKRRWHGRRHRRRTGSPPAGSMPARSPGRATAASSSRWGCSRSCHLRWWRQRGGLDRRPNPVRPTLWS